MDLELRCKVFWAYAEIWLELLELGYPEPVDDLKFVATELVYELPDWIKAIVNASDKHIVSALEHSIVEFGIWIAEGGFDASNN